MGIFADWQPVYAEHGVATFPVNIDETGKRPAVRGYLKAGRRASSEWAAKFGDNEALGFAVRPNQICVLDVDTPDENVLADALDRHGQTPLLIRSQSGNWQAWYRHAGEKRRVRPWKGRPIDVLGDGFTVAPPSRGEKGPYEIVQGSLDDLPDLPKMAAPPGEDAPEADVIDDTRPAETGRRNKTLHQHALILAHDCESEAELLRRAREHVLSHYSPPLPDAEIQRVVASAWGYTVRGENWAGRPRAQLLHAEIDALLPHPDALHLLTLLRRYHWGRTFVVANAMADQGLLKMSRKRLAAARHHLELHGFIAKIHGHSREHGPALYCWPN